MISTPITYQATNREWHKILMMARNNCFPEYIIHKLKKKTYQKQNKSHTNKPTSKTKQ